MIVATEPAPDRSPFTVSPIPPSDPDHAYSSDQTTPGVHTAKLGRVNGKLYGFLASIRAHRFRRGWSSSI
jgi:hypothetical protein